MLAAWWRLGACQARAAVSTRVGRVLVAAALICQACAASAPRVLQAEGVAAQRARRNPEGIVSYVGLNKLGVGCCRFAGGVHDAGYGNFVHAPGALTKEACAPLCTADPACKGYEVSSWGACELHRQEPVFATDTVGCFCLKKTPLLGPAPPPAPPAELLNKVTASGDKVSRLCRVPRLCVGLLKST